MSDGVGVFPPASANRGAAVPVGSVASRGSANVRGRDKTEGCQGRVGC
jgi:hypothetical protein